MILRDRPTMDPDNAKDIWILGAGFSRQISSDMPLMSDLSENVRDIISGRFDNSVILENVELALSELRSDAPWKPPDVKHQDMALYERVIERIRNQLQIPSNAMQEDQKTLVHRLVNTWHIDRSHVLTFNYDLLVEASAQNVRCKSFRDSDTERVRFMFPRYIYPIPIPHVRTRYGGTWSGNTSEITFSYYKLHGSLNYYTPPDPFQNTAMYHKHHDEVEDLAEGLRPFIVPPTNAKETFLEHPLLQTIWAKAAKVLANCDRGRIIIVGYSMPETDLTVLSMLREAIRSNSMDDGRVLPAILVVNPDPDAAPRIKELLGVSNPFGQVRDVTSFLEQYAPLEFIRTHVWDNRHKEDAMRQHQVWQERDGELSEDDLDLLGKLRNEAREQGRLGEEWFISREERVEWYRSIYQDIPVNRWL